MVLTTEQMKTTSGMISQLMGGGKNPAPPSVQKLGTRKTYNGFKCDEYKIAISSPIQSTGTYCVSPEINFEKEFRPLMDFSQELAQMFGGDAMKNLGFPVHTDSTVSILGQTIQSSSELVSYNRDAVPDSMFVVPAGLQRKADNTENEPIII